jgi:hypothetical protein
LNKTNEYEELYKEVKDFLDIKVWKTKKSRMNSEDRYLKYNFLSEVILNEYSVCMLALSVITLSQKDAKFDLLNLVLSILLLGVTLIVTCFRFKETANEYKNSYTQILLIEDQLNDLLLRINNQCLKEIDPYESFMNIKRNYQDILSNTPNHKYIDFLLMKKNSKKDKLEKKQNIYYHFRIVFGSFILIIIFLIPLSLIFYKLFY